MVRNKGHSKIEGSEHSSFYIESKNNQYLPMCLRREESLSERIFYYSFPAPVMYWMLDIVIENQLDSIWESCVAFKPDSCINAFKPDSCINQYFCVKNSQKQNEIHLFTFLNQMWLLLHFSFRRNYIANWLNCPVKLSCGGYLFVKVWLENKFSKYLRVIHWTRKEKNFFPF